MQIEKVNLDLNGTSERVTSDVSQRWVRRQSPNGVILLVVLGSLTFFSILVATFLVFSNESRDTSFALAQQESRSLDVKWAMNESLMTLLRGSSDPSNPFFGEDLLADYYGVTNGVEVEIETANKKTTDGQFVMLTIDSKKVGFGNSKKRFAGENIFAGASLTLLDGSLANRTYLIRLAEPNGNSGKYKIILELAGDEGTGTSDSIAKLKESTRGWLNSRPRDSVGMGYDATKDQYDFARPVGSLKSLPNLLAPLQPNFSDKSFDESGGGPKLLGDFDEDYDAADYNNWFLSQRLNVVGADGKISSSVIPSFHRPSVVNYLLNQVDPTTPDWKALLGSIQRGTFRPLPLAGQRNQSFTGGSSEFALRVPVLPKKQRVHQLANALINGRWDVDNDSDGVEDSVWVDLGLPMVVAPDGRILRPLVAPMIEDLSGRLNLNAHGSLFSSSYGTKDEEWFSQDGPNTKGFSDSDWKNADWARQTPIPTERVFRGIGFGPADIALPEMPGETVFQDLLKDRYANSLPGSGARDALDTLTHGYLPPQHGGSGWGSPTDLFGQSAVGLGLSGHVLTVPRDKSLQQDVNHPYEFDPRGRLAGDAAFSFADLEAVLRSSDFDAELLPSRIQKKLAALVNKYPSYRHAFTTLSASEDSPILSLMNLASVALAKKNQNGKTNPFFNDGGNFASEIFPPELRLGRKLDLNRAIGNGVDDDGNGIIDEPNEAENESFGIWRKLEVIDGEIVLKSSKGNIPTKFKGKDAAPSYTWDETKASTGRELLARHLYLLAMLIRHEMESPYRKGFLPVDDLKPEFLEEYTARRLAQWAVNVVDYRDPDSIMTRFEYDPEPFKGGNWNPSNGKNVVWGVESPQLIFSESLAFHDVRVRDMDRDDGSGKKKDPDDPDADPNSDQLRIPQGSLFLELYCPQAVGAGIDSTKPEAPAEFYSYDKNKGTMLDLARTAPDGAPVWRIAISEPHYDGVGTGKDEIRPSTFRNTRPDTASFEAGSVDELGNAGDSLVYERFILFNDLAKEDIDNSPNQVFESIREVLKGIKGIDMEANEVFFAPSFAADKEINAQRGLEAGQYLVLAPRLSTPLGSSEFNGGYPGIPSQQRFDVIKGQGLIQGNHANIRVTPELGPGKEAMPALPLLIAAPLPDNSWVTSNHLPNNVVGLNLSEPLPRNKTGTTNYYQQPSTRLNGEENVDGVNGPDYPLADSYFDFKSEDGSAKDRPFDLDNPRIRNNGIEPKLGTQVDQCTAFLQRLANPLLAYHKDTNPYRTVDWISIDLNVFSGEERPSKIDPDPKYATRSRQRNGFIKDLATGVPRQANALFSYETNDEDFVAGKAVGVNPGGDEYFRFGDTPHVQASLGLLNTTYPSRPSFNDGFVGFDPTLGSNPTDHQGGTTNDRNLPRVPFAIHPWLNRNFATPYEIMLVPACSAGRLFEEFTIPEEDDQVYVDGSSDALAAQKPFRHLLNFFQSGNGAIELSRVFEFVHTLPQFRNELRFVNPDISKSMNAQTGFENLMNPPFNFIYNNQRQGTINLNSISEYPVWLGLMQGHLTDEEYDNPNSAERLGFQRFVENRQGYREDSSRVSTLLNGFSNVCYRPDLHPELPTRFAGMYRSSLLSGKSMLRQLSSQNIRTINESSLFRSDALLRDSSPSKHPFFVRKMGDAPVVDSNDALRNQATNRLRNPWIRYQTLMRMPNLVSNNSQIFLIRLTLGYFEVDPVTGGLGDEYRATEGMAERFKGTFVIDRSIPVGYQPGVDMNTRDVVIFESLD